MRLEKVLVYLILCDVILVILGFVTDTAAAGTRSGHPLLTALWVGVVIGTSLSWIGLLNLVRGARLLYCGSWVGYLMLTLLSGPVVGTSVGQVVQLLGALVGGAIIALVYFTELDKKLRTIREAWHAIMPIVAVLLALSAAPALHAEVRPWTPAGVSSPMFESHAAFDPKSGDLYFVRSSPAFQGWRILVSRCTATGWSEPASPAFAGDGVEADPYFTPDGKSLYFISTRSLNGVKGKDLEIWRVDRGTDGAWGAPVHLPEPVNSKGAEWFPRPGPDGWLYFGSNRPGGLGGNDIWRARADKAGLWTVENLGPAVNTAGDEYEPLPSADGALLIVMAEDGLYETRKAKAGWSPRVKLPAEVNTNANEIGALFSPSGRSLLFSRDTKEPKSGEFFVWHEHGPEAWPPECPPNARGDGR